MISGMVKRLTAILVAAFVIPALAGATGLRIHASDLVQDTVRAICDAPDAPRTDLSAAGSLTAIDDVREGRAELAIVAIPDGATRPDDLACTPFAFDAAILVVNQGNPLKEVSLADLNTALAASAGACKWSALKPDNAWADRTIVLYLPSPSQGITLQLFLSQTLRDKPIRDGAIFMAAKDKPDVIVREQADCLMLVRGIRVPESGRALQISEKGGTDSFSYAPTESSVFYGDYTLRLPFYIVTKKNVSGDVHNLIAFLLSDAAAAKLNADGYVAVPKSERNN
jgi:ABC-type phosphate transport system substrate-binding protein